MKFKIIFTIIILCYSNIFSQGVIASWNFEGIVPNNIFNTTLFLAAGSSRMADAGALTAGSELTSSVGISTIFSTPVGNGSAKSLGSTGWTPGGYYQFRVATTNFKNIKLFWDQTGSNTAPASFKISYNITPTTDGFVDVFSYSLPNNLPTSNDAISWSAATPVTLDLTTFSIDLSAITELNNKDRVDFRITCTNTTTSIGAGSFFNTDGIIQVDNFKVTYNSVLPIELRSFEAIQKNNTTNIKWQTESEIDNAYFDIERSNNGHDFNTIGHIKAIGTAANYGWIDNIPINGINYYRLKQVDKGGEFTYSKTISVKMNQSGIKNTIYPTYTEGVIFIKNESLETKQVSVFNAVGHLVWKAQAIDKLDLTVLSSGIYFINIRGLREETTEKVIKH
jgi:Secretion system C-terminal sorting domain